jgi:broad specificity phosphatase PhoE
MAKKIYLMRHGESDGDVKNLFGGAFDDNATEKAKKEANLLISKLKELKIDAIVSSPYKRAKQVAEIFAKELNLPLEVIEEIRERNSYGIFSGQNKDEVRRKYPEIYGMMAFVAGKKNYLFTPEKAETYDDFCLRMDDAINRIKALLYGNVLVVTHGGVISCIMREKIGRELNGAGELKDFAVFRLC